MPVNLSIKNVPDEIVEQLRARAQAHHRSLQGELLTVLEETVAVPKKLSVEQILKKVRKLGLRTPREAAALIRVDREGR